MHLIESMKRRADLLSDEEYSDEELGTIERKVVKASRRDEEEPLGELGQMMEAIEDARRTDSRSQGGASTSPDKYFASRDGGESADSLHEVSFAFGRMFHSADGRSVLPGVEEEGPEKRFLVARRRPASAAVVAGGDKDSSPDSSFASPLSGESPFVFKGKS